MTQLVWFRNDLRLADNPALTAALGQGERVEACFLATRRQWEAHDWAPVKIRFLEECLSSLARDLAALGIPFHLLDAGDFSASPEALLALCRERGITTLHFNREYAVNERQRDRRTRELLTARGCRVHAYHDQAVLPPDRLKTGKGTAYTVFTPFSRAWRQTLEQEPPALHPYPAAQGEALAPTKVSIADGLHDDSPSLLPAGGEQVAQRALLDFLDQRAGLYREQRNDPALEGTSRLSPYLALGVLSGRQCLVAARQAADREADAEGIQAWINEICWRDFYIQIMVHFPRICRHRAFRPETGQLPWNPAGPAFEAWCQGRTGIPLVDAGMRQLNQTGWMHNRLRMVTAMFLTKNLFIDWRLGERYFMRHLIDGYLPSNNGGWQWSASTGTDAAPYFRIFNPVTQAERFDPEGHFIREYLPELAHLQGKALFAPWKASQPPKDYPEPMVDLKESRRRAIEAFRLTQKS